MSWKCPWCNIGKRDLVDMKKHIHEIHECKEHFTYWLSNAQR